MKDRPILFSAPMVRAILSGQKTQTRRIITSRHIKFAQPSLDAAIERSPSLAAAFSPYGQTGDRLWVREAFSGPHYQSKSPPKEWSDCDHIWYWADGNPTSGDWTNIKPSIHMPRWACRIALEVTGVRVERLQDISRGDAMAEGCPFANMAEGPDPSKWYADLWSQINGDGAWDANPWVWVVEFKVLP